MAGVLDRFRLEGRVALVTGAGTGIGRAIAEALGQAGSAVVLCARREAPLREAESAIVRSGAKAHVVTGDVGNRESL
ncbi:MAG TPA: SDR family NAD(P)-dependent oxidoreductase, partial [Usitatibacter sp.]|nr:SDR family NAD(P)-dependent oxidoreductase [Usitatibacter sp.]